MTLVLDQQNSGATNDGWYIRESSSQLAGGQSFAPSVTADIGRIIFKLYRDTTLTGATAVVKLYSNSGGVPNTVLATSTTSYDISTLPTTRPNAIEVSFDFAAGTSMTSGTTYWAIVDGTWGPTSTGLGMDQMSGDTFGTGEFRYYNGSNWVTRGAGYDSYFKEYYQAASGPANLKTVNGLAKASIKTIDGLAIASVKTYNGLA